MSKRKKMVSLLLALVLCVGLLPVTVLAEPQEDSLTYVALGDSMSQGYMFIDYNEEVPIDYSGYPINDYEQTHYCGWRGTSEKSYIKKFEQHLKDVAPSNVEVELIDLTIQGLQPDEVYAFLQPDTFDFDSMTKGARKHIGWWVGDYETDEAQSFDESVYIFPTFKSMSNYYIDAIKKADVITYDIGENFFGTYLTDYRGEDEVFTNLIENGELATQLATVRTQLVSLLRENGLESMISSLDGVLYAYASYIVYSKKCIDAIYELNPDVQVIVIPLSSPHQELYIQVDEENKVEYTTIMNFVMESLNLYMRNYAKTLNAAGNNCTVAQLSGHVMSFVDELYFYPNDLSEDVVALLESAALGEQSVLGSQNFEAPSQVVAVVEQYNDVFKTEYPGYVSFLQMMGMWDAFTFDYGFNPTDTTTKNLYDGFLVNKDEQTEKYMLTMPTLDYLVYTGISNKYSPETAFADFFGTGTDLAASVPVLTPMLNPYFAAPTTPSLLQDNFDRGYTGSYGIHIENINCARTHDDADWQKHILEFVEPLLRKWKDICLEAVKQRDFPIEAFLGGGMMPSAEGLLTSGIGEVDIPYLFEHPNEIPDDMLLAIHAGLRNSAAARGFGAHPCPRGLDVKYRAVLAAYYNDSAELELAEEYKGEILELADQIGKLIKKYGPDAIEAIEKKLATPEQIDTVHNLLDAISKSSNKFEQFALSVKLATELYQIADQNELVPEKIVKTIENTKQALAMMQDVGKKVAVGAAVGTAAAAGVSVARYVIEKKQAAKEAAVAKEAAAEAKAVQSAARINTVGGVQQWLNDNYNAGLTVDGGYGNMTKQAIVKALQKELGFTGADVDGVAGSKTLNALPELNGDSQGNTVVLLQCLLLGGGYGNDVEQAVLALQKAQGMTQTGVCDSQVWKALLG